MSEQAPRIQQLNRRRFLQLTGITSGGLILAATTGCDQASSLTADGNFAPNVFLNVAPNDRITVHIPNAEMGQGVNTALAMILAEEMDASWDDIQVAAAPIDPERFGFQGAQGSLSILAAWKTLRRAGATARAMLQDAGAEQLEVSVSELKLRSGFVHHEASGRKLSFGQLAVLAAQQRKPIKYFLSFKDPKDYQLLGSSVTNIDATNIVRGEQVYSIDIDLPGMRYAVYAKAPQRGASLVDANLEAVRARPGVVEVFAVAGNNNREGLCPGIAIIADNSWSAMQAKAALEATWADDGATDSWSYARTKAMEEAGADGPIEVSRQGDLQAALAQAQTQVAATYSYHFIAHAQLEPLSCTAWFQNAQLELWCASQAPDTARSQAATLAGLNDAQVQLHQQRGGGAFGRRLYHDLILEAVAIATRVDYPIKLVRSREDDMHSEFHRGGGFHHLRAGLDANHQLQAWRDHFVSFTSNGTRGVRGGNLSANEFPIPLVANTKVTQSLLDWQTPVGNCRSPGANVFAFVTQSFLGELSANVGQDHLEFLLQLLGEPRWLDRGNFDSLNTERAAKVLTEAAKLGGWGQRLPTGQGLGLAFHFSHGGYFAEVAKVAVSGNRRLQVQEVSLVGDVGPIINMSGARAQCEGCVMDGLSILLGQKITVENGIVEQSNFDRYPVLRMPQAPKIRIEFLQTWDKPSGLGEPALPPLAPAVANAIFAATGERVRTLPFSEQGYHA